jgi:flagellar biogenesis protein FliO
LATLRNLFFDSEMDFIAKTMRGLKLGRALSLASLLGLALPCLAGPPSTVFGTKADPTPASSQAPGLGFMPFLQMMLALGIVLVLVKFLMPKLLGGLNKKIVAKSGGGIEIEESATIGGGQLYVVNVRDKSLLLCASQSGVTCLTELGPKKPKVEQPLFMDILQQETAQPSHMYVDQQGEPSPAMKSALSDDEIQAALERLNKLGG